MRSPWLPAALTLLLLSINNLPLVSAKGHFLALRQDPTATISQTIEPVQTTDAPREDNGQDGEGDSFSSNSTSRAPSPTDSSALPTSTLLSNGTNLNETFADGMMAPPGELPLMPVITPALSVAGVLLMITGAVFCLIGIKNKWIQIFISSAYLTSLAIVVLILYIMKPPITNAIQGAYLAGVVAPALILGGGALVFRDVTEGLGCAIGGFCLSMFFLVLKPGGTITSQAGKAIFIGVFTAVSFIFSFSRYTRSYGIIGSTALGGATAIVLGIDCFSRAGLKEFWVYIWALNDDLFPLLQDTYPITRGIRVEIAGTVVFTFFGVLSQLKIWKVIQARRERKEQERTEANRERDELEAQIGRDVESGNDRDRGQWEAIYGDKEQTQVDSGIGTESGSTRKGSVSTFTKETGTREDSYEMENLPSPRLPDLPDHGDAMVIRVGEDDWGFAQSIKSRATSVKEGAVSVKAASVKSGVAPGRASAVASPVPEDSVNKPESRGAVSPEPSPKEVVPQKPKPARVAGPKVVPLPFKIPDDEKLDEDDAASHATFNDSEAGGKRYSQRFSGLHLMRRLSNRSKRNSHAASIKTTSSVEALVDHSVADNSERSSTKQSSRSNSFTKDGMIASEVFEPPGQGFSFDFDTSKPEQPESPRTVDHPENSKDSVKETTWVPLTLTNLEGEKAAAKAEKSSNNETGEKDGIEDKAASTTSDEKPAPITELKSHLPNDSSKVVLQYRTNEWAKHLSNAETPEVEEIRVPEPIVEEPTTVNAKALLQTAHTAEPKPAQLPPQAHRPKTPKSPKQSARSPPSSATPLPGRIPSFSMNSSGSPTISPNTSMTSLVDPNPTRASLPSQAGFVPRRAPSALALRSTSSPLLASPIDEETEATFHTPLPNETLLATRSTMLKHKAVNGSTGSLLSNLPPSARNTPSPLPLHHMGSNSSLVGSAGSQSSESPALSPDDDNMSLSARRAHLQRSNTTSPAPQQALMLPTATYTSNRDQQPADIRRSTTDPAVRRASMLAAWRQSIAKDVQRGRPEEIEVQMRREEMWEQRKRDQDEIARRREAEGGWGRSGSRQSKRVSRMSNMSGREMNDAHREVLRRMQAGANKKLKEEGQ